MNAHSVSWSIRGQDTRRWAFYSIGAMMCPIDTGRLYGPVQWLESAPPASAPRHESQRLFTPVDVLPGQMML